ncbi:MAG: S-layer homology domain-containing protein [Clostridia bacterium]|nr:S-layer homology domain-containing protein [Clostridia bacterium]
MLNNLSNIFPFTLLYNVLKHTNHLPAEKSTQKPSDLKDVKGVAPWAEEAMSELIDAGCVIGSNGALYPTQQATRAQHAQILFELLQK